MARNIEDLAAARITPIIPAKVLQPISASQIADSWVSIKYCLLNLPQQYLHLQYNQHVFLFIVTILRDQ